MSWITYLYRTYENVMRADPREREGLLPIAHTTQNANITVFLDEKGNFIGSRVMEKPGKGSHDERSTLIPCTEASAGRSGIFPAPHPLCDKLQYLAGDYQKYGGAKGDLFHKKYMEQLTAWCESPYQNRCACKILAYLKKSTLIADLVDDRTLICDGRNRLLEKWDGDKKQMPAIFRSLSAGLGQFDAFIRFSVDGTDVWTDEEIQRDFIAYYLSLQTGADLCYVTGKETACSSNHPKRIRNSGDQAKLISVGNKNRLAYEGRFLEPGQAAQVGYEVSQKAHNALKWLIQKQGATFGDRVFLLWGTQNERLPALTDDTWNLCRRAEAENIEGIGLGASLLRSEPAYWYTAEDMAVRFNKAISGYRAELDYQSEVALMGLDAATTGRLCVVFYREFRGSEAGNLIERVKRWHETCSWRQRVWLAKEQKRVSFIGAPSPETIALAAYGTEQEGRLKANEKLAAKTIERLLKCISEGTPIPYDIVCAAVNNACGPQQYINSDHWDTVVRAACALTKKYRSEKYKEVWNVDINETNKINDVAYNCGRLLAVAHQIELRALRASGDKRTTTNAIRYLPRFRTAPCATWPVIVERVIPYANKLGILADDLRKLIGKISSEIPQEAFAAAKDLDGRMLLGFDAQRNVFYNAKNKGGDHDEDSAEQD